MRGVPSRGAALLAATAVALAACAAPADMPGPQGTDEGRTVHIDMSEFAFDPPQIVLAAGETVTIVLTNVGKVEHEFMAGTGVMSGMGYRDDWLAMAKPKGLAQHAEHGGAGILVAPHTTSKVILVVPAQTGQFEFGCFVEGHYEGGMHGVIVVAGVAGATAAPRTSTGPATPMPAMSGHPGDMDEEQH